MAKKVTVDKDKLIKLYIDEQLSTRDIAKLLGTSQSTVRRKMKLYGIEARDAVQSKNTPSYKQKVEDLAERYRNEYTVYYNKVCPQCGKEFTVTSKQKDKIYCSKECANNSLKTPIKKQYCERCGKEIEITNNRNYKRKYCSDCMLIGRAETQRNRIKTNCAYCGKELFVTPSVYNSYKHHYCDVKCMAKYFAEHYSGENSPTYKNGKRHYQGNWKQAREARLEIDKHICQICGKTEEENKRSLDVHHIKSYHDFEDKIEANQIDNLVSLCTDCHRFVHSNANVDKIYIK